MARIAKLLGISASVGVDGKVIFIIVVQVVAGNTGDHAVFQFDSGPQHVCQRLERPAPAGRGIYDQNLVAPDR